MKITLKYFTLLLAFTFLYRILFIFKYFDNINSPLSTLSNAFSVDISTVSYTTLLFTILYLIFRITNFKFFDILIKYLSFFICFILFLAEYSSLTIYEHWGSTVSYRATSYLENGSNGWNTLIENIDSYIAPSFIIFILHVYLTNHILKQTKLKFSLLLSIITIPILLLMIRGGLQKIPISSSKSFFSKNQTDNYTAVNKLRYFLDSYLNSQSYNELTTSNFNLVNIDSTMNINCVDYSITKSKTPDIILLVMEGIPNSALELKKGDTLIAQNINRISKKGLIYTNAFSSGFRTDQGIVSIFNGLPAYPYLNVLKKFSDLNKHDNLINEISNLGYKTTFMYGGESQFSDMKKYLLDTELDDLIDSDYFPDHNKTSSWGVPDHILLDTAYNYIKRSSGPTFTTILTSSSHVPFDIPGRNTKKYSTKENFIASIEYLDKAINVFEERVSNLNEKEILLIITSDHGSMHLGHDYNDHERFHIPLFVTGNCLDSIYKNKEYHKNISLHDIPASILSIFDNYIHPPKFNISTNIFSNCPESNSYWITDNALGYIENSHNLGLDHRNGNVFKSNLEQDSVALYFLKQNAVATFNYYKHYLLNK